MIRELEEWCDKIAAAVTRLEDLSTAAGNGAISAFRSHVIATCWVKLNSAKYPLGQKLGPTAARRGSTRTVLGWSTEIH
jgi:hypothetical protein